MIYPRCKADYRQDYVNAQGLVLPCSWIGERDSLEEYKKLHAEYLKELSVLHRPLEDILNDPRYYKLAASWTAKNPFIACRHHCSAPLPEADGKFLAGNNSGYKIPLKPANS